MHGYPQEVHDFVRENCTKMRDAQLAQECNAALGTNFTKSKMQTFRYNHGYLNHLGKLKPEEIANRKYSMEVIDYIRKNSWGVSSAEMTERLKEKFGIVSTPRQIKVLRQKLGVKSGCKGWYLKSHEPGNKGLKIEEYMSPEAIEKSKKTRFKKGDRPANELPVGTVIRHSSGYMIRKRSMKGKQWERWEFLHRAVWEEHNGPIPKGYKIIFKDRDKTNCDISNLLLVSAQDLAIMIRKGYLSEDPEVTEAGAMLASLSNTARERKKHGRKTKTAPGTVQGTE